MRIIRNERRINTLSFVGRYATLAGMVVLLAGLIISFARPEWLTPMFICVIVGVGLSIVGGFFAERYVSPLAHHNALATALKGLDDRFTLIQYILPAPHVLVEPGGITVFVVKAHGGQVTCQDGRWKHRQRSKFFRQFAGQEAVGLPHVEAETQVRKLERWMEDHEPDTEIPVRAAIVFVNPDLELDADASPVPTFYGKKVKGWLRGPGKLKPLPEKAQRWLEETIAAASPQSEE